MRALAEREPQRDPPRRVLALVLPTLLLELARQTGAERAPGAEHEHGQRSGRSRRLPVAVVVDDVVRQSSDGQPEEVTATSVLSAVNDVAYRLGIREGQTVAEARALASRLVVRQLARPRVDEGLARIAEIALGFGSVVAFSSPDTVWVDITGVAHLFGGETGLVAELLGRVREAGHRARAAISDGPLLAQAFARFGDITPEGFCVVPSALTVSELARLPVAALKLTRDLEGWFVRLGVLTIGDLAALPRGALAARLAEHTAGVLDLIAGRDATPLVRYEPPRTLIEETTWDEPCDGREPLLFVLRGLVARISARLRGRGEAAQVLVLRIAAEPSIARFRAVPREVKLEFSLPKPLHREEELGRILTSRLERVVLEAPSVGLRLEVPKLIECTPRQLELGSLLFGAKADALDELPIVLAELGADIGADRVGILKTFDSHRPELTSRLVTALPPNNERPRLKKARPPRAVSTASPAGAPPFMERLNRLLPQPIPFESPLRAGASVLIDHRFYTIEEVRFAHRLEAVEWWARSVNRDYVRVVLRGAQSAFEALVFVDRETGQRYLQGIFD